MKTTQLTHRLSSFIIIFSLFFLINGCDDDDDDNWANFTIGYDCEDCKYVNLLSSCDSGNSTLIPISCDEFNRLNEIRSNSTVACIEITVNPSDGGQAVIGYGRDWFFNCN